MAGNRIVAWSGYPRRSCHCRWRSGCVPAAEGTRDGVDARGRHPGLAGWRGWGGWAGWLRPNGRARPFQTSRRHASLSPRGVAVQQRLGRAAEGRPRRVRWARRTRVWHRSWGGVGGGDDTGQTRRDFRESVGGCVVRSVGSCRRLAASAGRGRREAGWQLASLLSGLAAISQRGPAGADYRGVLPSVVGSRRRGGSWAGRRTDRRILCAAVLHGEGGRSGRSRLGERGRGRD